MYVIFDIFASQMMMMYGLVCLPNFYLYRPHGTAHPKKFSF